MVDSDNVLIFADKRITIEDISEQLEISVGTAVAVANIYREGHVTTHNCE